MISPPAAPAQVIPIDTPRPGACAVPISRQRGQGLAAHFVRRMIGEIPTGGDAA